MSIRTSLAVLALVAASAAHAGDPEAPVARAGSAEIHRAELDARTANRRAAEDEAFRTNTRRLQLQHDRNVHDVEVQELERLVDERLTEQEAVARHLTVPALLATLEYRDPSKAEVYAYYEQHQAQFNAPFVVVSDMIREHLVAAEHERVAAEFHAGLRQKHGVENHLEAPRYTVSGSGPSRGPADAAVTIVEFADFQCPYCVREAPTLARLLASYPADVRLEFRQLPLTNLHPEAQRAAEASVCAAEQHRFWEFHDAVFATEGRFDASALFDAAKQAGIELDAFRGCLSSGRAAPAIQQDMAVADDLVIGGTPAMFINGRLLAGAVPYEQLVAVVDDELRRAGRTSMAPHAVTER